MGVEVCKASFKSKSYNCIHIYFLGSLLQTNSNKVHFIIWYQLENCTHERLHPLTFHQILNNTNLSPRNILEIARNFQQWKLELELFQWFLSQATLFSQTFVEATKTKFFSCFLLCSPTTPKVAIKTKIKTIHALQNEKDQLKLFWCKLSIRRWNKKI